MYSINYLQIVFGNKELAAISLLLLCNVSFECYQMIIICDNLHVFMSAKKLYF